MTSLNAAAPEAGRLSWSADLNEQATADDARFKTEMRVRFVSIQHAQVRFEPKPHVVYRIDVQTQSDRWTVYRRYSHFVELHAKLVKQFGLKRSMLPGKRLAGNFSPTLINERKTALEHYLLQLVSSHPRVLFSLPLLDFLDVNRRDVVAVAAKLAHFFREHGPSILARDIAFKLTPNQCRCIWRRRLLPMDAHVSLLRMTESPEVYGTPADLPYLYDFVSHLKSLCVRPRPDPRYGTPSHIDVDTTPADISLFTALTSLELHYLLISKLTGLSQVQQSLIALRCHNCNLKAMKGILMDSVIQKRRSVHTAGAPAASSPKRPAESWRQSALERLAGERRIVRPWTNLTTLDLAFNNITSTDPACLAVLPALEQLILRFNSIESLNAWLFKGTVLPHLRLLDLSNNDIQSLVAPYDPVERNSVASLSHKSSSSRTSPALEPLQISAGWTRDSSHGSASDTPNSGVSGQAIASEGTSDSATSARRPSSKSIAPPDYDMPHLIATDKPDASLADLQRMRMERFRSSNKAITDASIEKLTVRLRSLSGTMLSKSNPDSIPDECPDRPPATPSSYTSAGSMQRPHQNTDKTDDDSPALKTGDEEQDMLASSRTQPVRLDSQLSSALAKLSAKRPAPIAGATSTDTVSDTDKRIVADDVPKLAEGKSPTRLNVDASSHDSNAKGPLASSPVLGSSFVRLASPSTSPVDGDTASTEADSWQPLTPSTAAVQPFSGGHDTNDSRLSVPQDSSQTLTISDDDEEDIAFEQSMQDEDGIDSVVRGRLVLRTSHRASPLQMRAMGEADSLRGSSSSNGGIYALSRAKQTAQEPLDSASAGVASVVRDAPEAPSGTDRFTMDEVQLIAKLGSSPREHVNDASDGDSDEDAIGRRSDEANTEVKSATQPAWDSGSLLKHSSLGQETSTSTSSAASISRAGSAQQGFPFASLTPQEQSSAEDLRSPLDDSGASSILAATEMDSSVPSTAGRVKRHYSAPQRSISQLSNISTLVPVKPPQLLHLLTPRLVELHIANNLLSSLRGLEKLHNLQYLDVRANRIATLDGLDAIDQLPSLNQLLLEGNPITRARAYRDFIWRRYSSHRSQLTIDGKPPE